jgi:hypothetical protein
MEHIARTGGDLDQPLNIRPMAAFLSATVRAALDILDQ